MQVPSRKYALTTFACLLAAAFAAQPLPAAAQTSTGKVLFWRNQKGTVNIGSRWNIGSTIYSVRDDGSGLRQLTPSKRGVFNLPALASWQPINAFSPSGRFSLYLKEHSDLDYPDPHVRGKFLVMDGRGGRVTTLFPGDDDLQAPSAGPGFGSVTWGPAGTDAIAYANAPDDQPHKHPACLRLMHPDGTGKHSLWCAPRLEYRAIEGIRWSGNGQKLLAYAVQTRDQQESRADLYMIDAGTGVATLIEANVQAPYNGGHIGNLSYDGREVIYAVMWNTPNPSPCSAATNSNTPELWCARNMVTGQAVALVDPASVVTSWGSRAELSPDGSQVVMAGHGNSNSDYELYAIHTDGTGLRKLTSPCVGDFRPGTDVYWTPIRYSPDGKRLLANCNFSAYQYPPQPGKGTHKIFVVDPADGSARFVAYGNAYDWHVPSI